METARAFLASTGSCDSTQQVPGVYCHQQLQGCMKLRYERMPRYATGCSFCPAGAGAAAADLAAGGCPTNNFGLNVQLQWNQAELVNAPLSSGSGSPSCS